MKASFAMSRTTHASRVMARSAESRDWVSQRLNSSKGKRRCMTWSLSSSESDSEEPIQDIVDARRAECQTWKELTGVLWLHFQFSKDDAGVVEEAKGIVQDKQVKHFYIGVCKSPAERFYKKPLPEWVPHMTRFHALYVLSFGRDMGRFEKKLLSECCSIAREKCVNKTFGGEGIHCRSLRFAYVAVTYCDNVGY